MGKSAFYSLITIGVLVSYWFYYSIPYFGNAFIPTHDGEYHIIRIFEFSQMLRSGYAVPLWAPHMNNGYGIPVFLFMYPFGNYMGSFFTFLGSGYINAFQYALITGYLTAILACFVFLRKQTTIFIACCSTLVFATVPYWFVDIHIRGSLGEVWAFAWIMVSFASIVWKKPSVLAVSIGLLILSHNIMAMISFPLLCFYVLMSEKKYIIFLMLGVLLSAFFWLPALLESRFMVGLNTVTFSDHFPTIYQLFRPTWGSIFSQPGAPPGEVSQQIGIVPVGIILSALVFFTFRRTWTRVNVFIIISISFAIFLMTSYSIVLWKSIPFLSFIQFPWRLLSIVVLTVPILSMNLFKYLRVSTVLLFVLLSFLVSYRYMKPTLYMPRTDEQYIYNPNFMNGTSSMGNSLSTVWTSWKQVKPPSRVTVVQGSADIIDMNSKILEDSFTIRSHGQSRIEIHRLYFPGWKVYINDASVRIDYGTNGTLMVDVPNGTSVLTAVFTNTPVRSIANMISIVSFATLIGRQIKKLYAYRT